MRLQPQVHDDRLMRDAFFRQGDARVARARWHAIVGAIRSDNGEEMRKCCGLSLCEATYLRQQCNCETAIKCFVYEHYHSTPRGFVAWSTSKVDCAMVTPP